MQASVGIGAFKIMFFYLSPESNIENGIGVIESEIQILN